MKRFRKMARIFFSICIIACVFTACKNPEDKARPDVKPELTFLIEGLDSNNRLVIESEEWTEIAYSTNAKHPVINFSYTHASIIVNGTASAENPMSAFAEKDAEDRNFSITAHLIDSELGAEEVEFSIYVKKSVPGEEPGGCGCSDDCTKCGGSCAGECECSDEGEEPCVCGCPIDCAKCTDSCTVECKCSAGGEEPGGCGCTEDCKECAGGCGGECKCSGHEETCVCGCPIDCAKCTNSCTSECKCSEEEPGNCKCPEDCKDCSGNCKECTCPGEIPVPLVLESIVVNNITINNQGGLYQISYSIAPAALQNEVTVVYFYPAATAYLEFFNSNHAEHPNKVRALTNTKGSYNVQARASYGGVTKNSTFTVTVTEIPLLASITAADVSVYVGETAAVSYTILPSTLQSSALVTYSYTGEGLTIRNSDAHLGANTVTANPDAAEGVRTVTATAVNPDVPNASVSVDFKVTVNRRPVPTSIMIQDISLYAGNSAAIAYTIQPSSLQSSALVTYSYSGEGLVLRNSNAASNPNTVYADENAAEGERIVTATAINPDVPNSPATVQFKVTVNRKTAPTSTKNYNDRGGQTLTQLASITGNSSATVNFTISPIDNIANFQPDYLDSYILGADIGSIIEVENAGGKFYDNDRYHVEDVMEILSYYGINWVRIRLWNDPYSSISTPYGRPYGAGTNDIEKAIEITKRAKKWGMKVLLNFHYSDFWAHPDQQIKPKAWSSYTTAAQLAPVLKQYTKDTLTRMYNECGLPDMVQVGNETLGGIAGIKDSSSPGNNEKMVFRAGLEAVREISAQYNYPIETMLHVTNGMSTVSWWFGAMKDLDFDVIGLSFYPMWHGNRTAFQEGLQSLANNFKKPIVIAEYSVSYTSAAGTPNGSNMYGNSNADARTFSDDNTDRTIRSQAQIIRNLNNDIMNNTLSGGVRYGYGAFWWEPAWLPLSNTGWAHAASREWYTWAGISGGPAANATGYLAVTWANQAWFSFTGTALPSLNAFREMMGKPPRVAQ